MTAVIGAGLAGSLLALALAERGLRVTLIDHGRGPNATALSYGLMPATAAGAWQRLQRRHGDLGLRRRWLQLGRAGLPLPAWQIDPCRFAAAAAGALSEAGVQRLQQRLDDPAALEPWLEAGPVVLACGAGCRALVPQLQARLRVSWAGLLELEPSWAGRLLGWRQGIAQLPERFARLALERHSHERSEEAWVVDAGLVPCGDRLLAGQISLIRPGLEAGDPPDPLLMEQHLRNALAARWPLLAAAPGQYRQSAVSFCTNGEPLAGLVEPGLWVLSGFSGAFAQLPASAAALAAAISAATG